MSAGDSDTVRATVDGYTLAEAGPLAGVDPVPPGSNVLLAGPPLVGKADMLADAVEYGVDRGETGIVVSPDDSYTALRNGRVPGSAYVVDCSTLTDEGFDAGRRVASVPSPTDLTGVGMAVLKCLRAAGSGPESGCRVALLSVSTLLQYTDADRVFNFLHVLTGRISAAGYLGLFAIDPTAHDETALNTIKSQFDGAIRLRQTGGDAGAVAADTVGL